MTDRLKGKVAIVVGAGSIGTEVGNGSATALRFAREGAVVVCVDRVPAAARATAERIVAEGGAASVFEADVREASQLEAMARACLDRHGRIDVLHNNVGVEAQHELIDVDEADWDRVLAINLRGPMLAARAVVPQMIAQGGGSIINVSSTASRRWSRMQYLSYSTSKAGLNHMTRIVARQYARHHVRCNVILPGMIDTPHAAALYPTPEAAEQGRRQRHAACPMGHQGTPWDVADAALFLASDESRYVTGLELVVDGGLSL